MNAPDYGPASSGWDWPDPEPWPVLTENVDSLEHCATVGPARCGTDRAYQLKCRGVACRLARSKQAQRSRFRRGAPR